MERGTEFEILSLCLLAVYTAVGCIPLVQLFRIANRAPYLGITTQKLFLGASSIAFVGTVFTITNR